MENTENDNKAAGAPSVLNVELEPDSINEKIKVMQEALDIAEQAINEMSHAYTDPMWFTGGVERARIHFFNWKIKAMTAISKAKQPSNDKNQGLSVSEVPLD